MQSATALGTTTHLSRFVKATVGAALALNINVLCAQPKPASSKPEGHANVTTRVGPTEDRAHSMCLGCHGIPGYRTAFPEVYHVPMIAGQQPAYFINALKAYAAGERSHPAMRAIASGLHDDVASTLAQQYGAVACTSDPPGLFAPTKRPSQAGKKQAEQICANCHGVVGDKPTDSGVPILAGQHFDYLVNALTDYKTGKRNNALMKGFAAQLSSGEVQDLAAWFSSQPSKLCVLPRE